MSDETKPQPPANGGGKQQPGGRARVAPLAVRIGTDNCQTIYLSSIKQAVRGGYSYTRLMMRPGGCRSAGALTQMPDLPGQQLNIYPGRKINLVISDPLEENQQLLDRANAVATQAASTRPSGGAKYTPVPTTEHQLSDDALKSLMMELERRREAGELEVVEGEWPTAAQIEQLPGRELYDPNNTSAIKPRYREDAAAWEQRLARQTDY